MTHKIAVDLDYYQEPLIAILRAVVEQDEFSRKKMVRLLKQHKKDNGAFFGADDLILAYRTFAGSNGLPPFDPAILERLRLKPVRTTSGVAVVTVLTKPYPC